MKAIDKLKWARTQLTFEHPFFGYLSLHLKIKETDMIDTVGVTKDFELLYNKHFIDNLDKEEVKGVLLHKLLHAVLMLVISNEKFADDMFEKYKKYLL